jgi:O-antigen ligase
MTTPGALRRSISHSRGLLLAVAGTSAIGTAGAALVDPIIAVAAITGAAGAVAVYVEPRLGLFALAAFTILRLPDVAADYHGAPSLFTPLVAIVLFSVAVRSLHRGETPPGGWRAAAAVGGLAAAALFSLLFASDLEAGVRELGFLAKDGAVAVLVGLLLGRTADLRSLVWVVVTGGFALSAVTTFQYLTGTFDTAYFGFAQSEVQNIVGATDDVRISGPIGDPNFYAQWLIMVIPLAIDRFHDERNTALRALAVVTMLTCVASTVFTFSRGALIALVIVIGVMVVRHPPRFSTVVGIGLAAILALPFLPSGYVDRMAALTDLGGVDIGTDPSLRARETETAVSIAMFLDHPLTGVGYGNYLPGYLDYSRDLGSDLLRKPREAHNLYLETAAETGLPGLVALGLVFGGAFAALRAGRRAFRDVGDMSTDGIGHALTVSIAGYLITSIFLHMAFARLIWLLVGIAFAFPSLAAAENRARDEALVPA